MSGGPLLSWPLPSARLALAADEVHVWRASLQVPESRLAQFNDTLSPDEKRRAARYRFLRDRQRFIVARGWLRAILGMYLHLPAGDVRFCYNQHGKPELDITPESAQDGPQFNLAHTEDLALCAVTRGRRVGIDVEYIRPGFANGTLAESFFTPRETALLRSLPKGEQKRAFFTCWTRKEAYLKARGEGLIMPLDAFEVSLLPQVAPALLQTPADPAEAARWSLFELEIGPGYAASLAVEGQGYRLWLWQDSGLEAKTIPAERKDT
jgi:4'-phosphopantetheinyl transferase